MTKIKAMFLLVVLGSCAACSEQKPDPMDIAKSNLRNHYTLMNGATVPLADWYCESQTIKAKNGVDYVDCRAKLQGYMNYEVFFCPTKPKMDCESTRPE